MATNKRAPNAPSRPSTAGDDFDLGMEDAELERLFAEALAGSSRTVRPQAAPRPPPPKAPNGRRAKDEDSLHILIDDLEGRDVDFSKFLDGDLELPKLGRGDDGDDLPEPDDLLATLDGLGAGAAAPAPDGDDDDDGDFDALDRELEEALRDEAADDDLDLQAAMESILSEGFGQRRGDEDSLPEIPEEAGDEEILGLGDDGAVVLPPRRDPTAALKAQVAEFGRALTIKDLELRTQEERIDTLEQQVVAATRQAANIGREFEASRRRAERERDDLKKFAAEKVLKEFLGVFDNLKRALDHAGPEAGGALAAGVQMILGQFGSSLRRCGVEEVASAPGDRFDPQWHEAVGQEPSDDIPAGKILARMHVGFSLNGRLLRAALVTVSRGPAGSSSDAPPLADEAPRGDDPDKAPLDQVVEAGPGAGGAAPNVEGTHESDASADAAAGAHRPTPPTKPARKGRSKQTVSEE